MQFKLFGYQRAGLAAIARARKARSRKALVVMASGLGKTVTAAFDVKRWLQNHGGKVLYLCHQNDILEQARNTFEAVLGHRYKYGYFHGHEKSHRGATCVFASFQTMRESRRTFKRNEFSYIVVDESHHGQATTYLPTLQYFTPDFLLGITATPDRRDLRDIRKIYGQEVFSLPLEVALAKGLLAKVDYRLLTDDLQNLDVLDTPVGRLSVRYLNKKLFVPRRDEEIARIIRRHMRKVDAPRVIIFCASVKHCDKLAAHLPESVAIHSRLSPNEQRARLRMFRDGLVNAILTVDKFNEGVDIPDANLIVFLRSTTSRTIFFQQLGRGLRRARGKESVVVLDFVANCERLQTINDLWEKVGEEEREYSPREPIPVMAVDSGKIHFTHVAKRVLDVLAAIRGGYTREMLIRQLRSLAKDLKRTPRQVDVTKASTQGKCAGATVFGRMFGSFSEALEVAGFSRASGSRRYTKAGMLKSLRTLAKKLGHSPIQKEVLRACRKGECPSVSAIANVFGSYTNALRTAGLIIKRRYGVSRDELIKDLQRLAKRLKRTPTNHDVHAVSRKSQGPSTALFVKEFGTLQKAQIAAGLRPVRVMHATRRELIKQLQKIAKKVGCTPTGSDIAAACKRGECASVSTFLDRFGSITKAHEAAGLAIRRSTKTRQTSKDELIRQLQQLAKKLKRTPLVSDIEVAYRKGKIASLSALGSRFGSYSKALRVAGLNQIFRTNYTKAEIIRELKALALKIRKTPAKHDVALAFRKGTCSVSTSGCNKLFGSFNAALVASGIEIAITSRRYTEKEILQQLQQLARKLKRTPTGRDVGAASRKGRCAHPSAIAVKFGTFNNAIRRAGLPVTRERS